MTGTDTTTEEKAQRTEYIQEAFALFANISVEFGEEIARRIFLTVANFKPKRKRGQRGRGKRLSANPSKDAERKRIKGDPAYALVSKLPPPSEK